MSLLEDLTDLDKTCNFLDKNTRPLYNYIKIESGVCQQLAVARENQA